MSNTEQYTPRRGGEIALLNGSEFSVIAEHELRRSRRDGDFLSLLWLRVDRRGPTALDASKVENLALRALGELVSLELRSSDAVALVGEADLAVLLPDTAPEQVAVVLEHLRATVFELAENGRTGLVARVGAATCAPGEPERELRALIEEARKSIDWIPALEESPNLMK